MIKKLLVALIACTMFFMACPNDDENNNGKKTTLTITNMNVREVCEVAYGDVIFDLVHNAELTKEVSAGTRYAYITYHYFSEAEYFGGIDLTTHNRTCSCPVFRTATITCEEGEKTKFGLTENSVVTFISGYGYDKRGDDTGTLLDFTSKIDDDWLKDRDKKSTGFDETQTWFWDEIESFNNAPNGTTQTITLTKSFEFPSVRRIYASSFYYSPFKKDQSNKKIIIQGDAFERTIKNSGKTLDNNFQTEMDGYLFVIPSGITLELGNNVTLDGNSIPFSTVIVEAGGTFIMNNGSTVKNTNDSGVLVEGAFTMNGGTISGNRHVSRGVDLPPSDGGGVVVKGGTFTMNGGTISNNVQSNHTYKGGGGVCVFEGTFTMKGGTISGNTTNSSQYINYPHIYSTYGGGVYVGAYAYSDSTSSKTAASFTKSGGTIDVTNSAEFGKVIYVDRSTGSDVRETTAGPSDNLTSAISGSGGGWEEE